jgi:hypothetical protein
VGVVGVVLGVAGIVYLAGLGVLLLLAVAPWLGRCAGVRRTLAAGEWQRSALEVWDSTGASATEQRFRVRDAAGLPTTYRRRSAFRRPFKPQSHELSCVAGVGGPRIIVARAEGGPFFLCYRRDPAIDLTELRRVHLRASTPGYDPVQVREFLNEVANALDDGRSMPDQQARDVTFGLAGTGVDPDQVDDLLETVQVHLASR